MQDTICSLHGYIMHAKKTADHSKTPIISDAPLSQLKNTGNNFRLITSLDGSWGGQGPEGLEHKLAGLVGQEGSTHGNRSVEAVA